MLRFFPLVSLDVVLEDLFQCRGRIYICLELLLCVTVMYLTSVCLEAALIFFSGLIWEFWLKIFFVYLKVVGRFRHFLRWDSFNSLSCLLKPLSSSSTRRIGVIPKTQVTSLQQMQHGWLCLFSVNYGWYFYVSDLFSLSSVVFLGLIRSNHSTDQLSHGQCCQGRKFSLWAISPWLDQCFCLFTSNWGIHKHFLFFYFKGRLLDKRPHSVRGEKLHTWPAVKKMWLLLHLHLKYTCTLFNFRVVHAGLRLLSYPLYASTLSCNYGFLQGVFCPYVLFFTWPSYF